MGYVFFIQHKRSVYKTCKSATELNGGFTFGVL